MRFKRTEHILRFLFFFFIEMYSYELYLYIQKKK